MSYFAKLLSFRVPQMQGLLDIALLLSLVPHLFALKGFMFVYLLVAFYFIVKKRQKKYDSIALFIFGLFMIGLSFLNNYNFADFSRMQFFVSFISSLLILGVSLQRLTHEINFYLKLSPVLLMLLSFFFFDTIVMLFYSLFVFFVFVLLHIWSRMDAPFGEVLRFNSALFLLSLPAVVVLFIAFPRISFEKADFGFRGEGYSSSEFDGSMYVSDKPFVPSNKIVMELFFEKNMPPPSALYFRGSVLNSQNATSWQRDENHSSKDILSKKEQIISYDALIHAHGKKWLYPLDIPIKDEYKKSELQKEYTLLATKELYETKRYRFTSALHYTLLTSQADAYLEHNASASPKTFAALHFLREANLSVQKRAEALLAFFQTQELAYTIAPKGLRKESLVDSFLFEAKNGYCTHFAASFATAARMVGIPSRVVSGYKADYTNRVENYLVVKQKDAHAWVELYLDDLGWVRYEPTATAQKNLDLLKEEAKTEQKKAFEKLNLHYMYMKYLISNWVLGFDRLKQVAMLESLLNDTLYLLKFVGSLLLLTLSSFLLFYLIKNINSDDKLSRSMKRLYRFLEKKGFVKRSSESVEHFLQRCEREQEISLEDINTEYHRLKYSKNKESLENLKRAIDKLLSTP